MKRRVLSIILALALILGTAAFSITASAETSGDFEYELLYIGMNDTVEITGYTGSATKLDIPSTIDGKSVTDIGWYAFENCTSLKSVTIPDSVTRIGGYAFENCTSLTSITIPNSVKSIGENAFENCSSLASITIPNSVTNVGGYAFYNTALYNNESNWSNNVLYIGKYLISGMLIKDYAVIKEAKGDYKIKDGTKVIADCAFEDCTSLTSITIPNSVTDIGSYAFYWCDSLTSVTIPDSVTDIGWKAFGYYWDGENGINKTIKGFRIYCYQDTAGKQYAIDNEFEYTLLEQPIITPPSFTTYGDADGSGKINIFDVLTIQRHLAGQKVSINLDAADVTHDDKVNIFDTLKLCKYLAGQRVDLNTK